MQTFWLSFCDADRPTGQQFLGVVIVDVDETDVARAEPTATALRASHGLGPLTDEGDRYLAGAIDKTHRLGCNPGGEVMAHRIDDAPQFAEMSPRYPRNTLLSLAALEAIAPVTRMPSETGEAAPGPTNGRTGL